MELSQELGFGMPKLILNKKHEAACNKKREQEEATIFVVTPHIDENNAHRPEARKEKKNYVGRGNSPYIN
eukprot:1161445-Pelagomonas_calceolata.AAC.1